MIVCKLVYFGQQMILSSEESELPTDLPLGAAEKWAWREARPYPVDYLDTCEQVKSSGFSIHQP